MTITVHAASVVVPIVSPPIADGAVVVDGERIVAVGRRTDIESSYGAAAHTYDGVLTPGLVNAHTHLELTMHADMAAVDEPFDVWIGMFLRRYRETTPEQWLDSARDGIRRSFAAGTTAVADVVTHGYGAQAAAEFGIAGIRYQEVVGADDVRWPHIRQEIELRLDRADAGLSPHTLYTVSSEALRDVAAMARARGIRLHPHAAETVAESEFVATGTGLLAAHAERMGLLLDLAGFGSGGTPVQRLDALGLLGDDVHLAHGIHVDAADRALLRQRRTAVALCPRSNAILRAGEAPVADYLREGNVVAVGTDSLASNVDLDVLGDVRALHALARKQGYEAGDLSRSLFEAATVGGSVALGRTDIGRLAPGARADLAVFDVPTDGDPYDALVQLGHGSCTTTVLAGATVYRKEIA
ncbi:MAG: amidohydrolase [Frankiales bacterium]|nr:amidohydrolase [Frankiales bacterium]